jgi:GNAT superfamily N-acetyltransferase
VSVLSNVEKLTKSHDVSAFDCGNEALNDWLKRYALVNVLSDAVQTYVVHRRKVVTGFYSLLAGSVKPQEVPRRVAKGLSRHPMGVIVLARLAVDKSEQGKGLGQALVKDALIRSERAADVVGVRAILVHAIDENARRFYEHFNFESSPLDPLQLLLLMKDLRVCLKKV